jgi:hypothetical protein
LHCVNEEGGRILGFEICHVLSVLHGTHWWWLRCIKLGFCDLFLRGS